jgi:hypothetical protein
MKDTQLVETHKVLIHKWQLALPENITDESHLHDTLLHALKVRVLYLLEHNYTKLMNALYRLDVPEHESAAALSLQKPEPIAEALSEVILKRELQKMYSRRQRREALGDGPNRIEQHGSQ